MDLPRAYLIDASIYIFRAWFSLPDRWYTADGLPLNAVYGYTRFLLEFLDDQRPEHCAAAFDESLGTCFRNDLYPGYKTGEGIEPTLREQFEPLEDVLEAAGFSVFRMVEYEADDGLAAAARIAADDARVEQVVICTPDKDLAQCVTDDGRIVQYDRRKRQLIDRDGVIEKFGVAPESIPDYLALVGDTADGFPGLKGWGAKSTATVLSRYRHLEDTPDAPGQWDVTVRGAAKLAATLAEERDDAYLSRRIATVDVEGPEVGIVDDLEYRGTTPGFAEFCERIEAPGLIR